MGGDLGVTGGTVPPKNLRGGTAHVSVPLIFREVVLQDILREDLRRMFRWSQDWQMLFNLEKCSVMHMGKRNQELYEMGGKVLKVSEEERDLGVIMHRSAKPSRQCAEASKKANSTLGMIRRTIVTRDKDTILRLYKSLVRPQLE